MAKSLAAMIADDPATDTDTDTDTDADSEIVDATEATDESASDEIAKAADEDEKTAEATDEDSDKSESGAEDAEPDDDAKPKDEDDYSVRDFAKEINGEECAAALANLKSDEDLVKSWWESQKVIGRRHEDSEIVKFLRENNVTGPDIQRILVERGQTKPAANGQAEKEWDPAWVQINAKGEWSPTAKAPTDIERRMERRRAVLAEAMADDAKLAEMLRPHLSKDIEAKTEAAKFEAEQRAAQQEVQRDFLAWTQEKRNLLFVEGSDQLTPLGKTVEDILQSGTISRDLSWRKQAEKAMEWALDKSKPNPPRTAISPKARHQTSPAAGTKHKLSNQEFFKKYGDNLGQWIAYNETGELPS